MSERIKCGSPGCGKEISKSEAHISPNGYYVCDECHEKREPIKKCRDCGKDSVKDYLDFQIYYDNNGIVFCFPCSHNYAECGQCGRSPLKKSQLKIVDGAISENNNRCLECYNKIQQEREERERREREERERREREERERNKKECSECFKETKIEETETSTTWLGYSFFSLNNNTDIYVCKNCWKNKKNDYKKQLKEDINEYNKTCFESEKKEINAYISEKTLNKNSIWINHSTTLIYPCNECNNWNNHNMHHSGGFKTFYYCSPKCEKVVIEKAELSTLREQWKMFKDFPSNYPGREEIKNRLKELEKKYSKEDDNNLTILDQIEQYFIENSISSITLKNNQLEIEKENGEKEIIEIDTTKLENIKKYCQMQSNYSITKNWIQREREREQNPTNYIPWIIGGVGILAVLGIIIALIRNNKKNKKL